MARRPLFELEKWPDGRPSGLSPELYVIRHVPSKKLCRVRTAGKDTGLTKNYCDLGAATRMLNRLNNGEEPPTVVIPYKPQPHMDYKVKGCESCEEVS